MTAAQRKDADMKAQASVGGRVRADSRGVGVWNTATAASVRICVNAEPPTTPRTMQAAIAAKHAEKVAAGGAAAPKKK